MKIKQKISHCRFCDNRLNADTMNCTKCGGNQFATPIVTDETLWDIKVDMFTADAEAAGDSDTGDKLVFDTVIDQNAAGEIIYTSNRGAGYTVNVCMYLILYILLRYVCDMIAGKAGLLTGLIVCIPFIIGALIVCGRQANQDKTLAYNNWILSFYEESPAGFIKRRYICTDDGIEIYNGDTGDFLRKIHYRNIVLWKETEHYVFMQSQSGFMLTLYKTEVYQKRLKELLQVEAPQLKWQKK